MIESLVPAISTYAGDVDNLFLLIFVLVGFWFLLTEGVFFYFIFRYRAKDGEAAQYVSGEEKHHKRPITIAHALVIVCDVFIVIGAVRVWVEVKQTLPEPDATVRIIGQQWAWSFVHPGPDNVLDTPDDIKTVNELHIEANRTYHYQLESRDVLHNFSVPVFRLKQDAVPGRRIMGWFRATQTGEYDIQCAEICGIGHGIMAARIHIEDPTEHAAWITEHGSSPVSYAAAE